MQFRGINICNLEMSRNAFVEVTGKGLPEIRADAINEMIFELTKDSPQITLSDIENYTRNLLEKFWDILVLWLNQCFEMLNVI